MAYYRWDDIKNRALSAEAIERVGRAVRRELNRLRVRYALRRATVKRRLAARLINRS